jgi:hypothetical protein
VNDLKSLGLSLYKYVFSVFDSKAEVYKHVLFYTHKGEATRQFADVANDEKTEIGLHPEDYTLFYLGRFDQTTGKFENNMTPESMGVAIEYKKVKEK